MAQDQDKPPEQAAVQPHPWKEQFVKFINDKVPSSGLCKECNQKAIVVSDDITTAPVFKNGGMMIGGPAYPQVMLICTNCGNTRFFNALIAGVVDGSNVG